LIGGSGGIAAEPETMDQRPLIVIALLALALLGALTLSKRWAEKYTFRLSDSVAERDVQIERTRNRPRAAAPENTPIHVGSILGGGPKLLTKTTPRLPAAAKRMGIVGPVFLEITIDVGGNVSATRVIRGDPLLNPLAEDAVKQWKYEPFTFKGHAISIVSTIVVSFRD
jgi:TonB family protein